MGKLDPAIKAIRDAEAAEELKKIKRAEARKRRHDRKKAEELGMSYEEFIAKGGGGRRWNSKYSPAVIARQNEASPVPDTDELDPEDLTPPTVEEMKENLQYAFAALGGKKGLVEWGRRYPKEFYAMWMKYNAPKDDEGASGDGDSLEDRLKQLDMRGSTVQ